jgi:hypothetical protein
MYELAQPTKAEHEPDKGERMARVKQSFQKGSVQFHNGCWTVRYRERDHLGNWKWKREKLPGCKGKKDAENAASLVLADVNRQNNNPAPRKMQAGTFRQFVDDLWRVCR